MEDKFFMESASPTGDGYVVVEDNGRVCYAYMLSPNQDILSHVWLYNRLTVPLLEPCEGEGDAPLNAAMYVKDHCEYILPESEHDIEVSWEKDAEDVTVATIRVSNKVVAQLTAHKNPGSSLMAKLKGPLADILIIDSRTGVDGPNAP